MPFFDRDILMVVREKKVPAAGLSGFAVEIHVWGLRRCYRRGIYHGVFLVGDCEKKPTDRHVSPLRMRYATLV